METVRCFGGIMDGKRVKLGERTELFREPLQPMPLAIVGPDAAPCTVAAPRSQLYRLRTVRNLRDEVYFYAPEEWDDITALRRALG
jgi:hypothetical protein